MATKLTLIFLFLFTLTFFITHAIASPVNVPRDIWDPRIITPHGHTVWCTGHKYNVTWETDDAPVNITHSTGRVVLGKGGMQGQAVLASNLSIRLGIIEITVLEDLETGNRL